MMSTIAKQVDDDIHMSPTLAINQRTKELSASGKKVFRFGFGQSPFPVPQPVVEALQTHVFQKDYLPSDGLPQLRAAVANHYQKRINIPFTADRVLIGPGSKELLFLIQLCHPADVLLASPSWVSYAPQAGILNRTVHWLDTAGEDGYRLRAETLNLFCQQADERRKILILNYPNNPVGSTYSPEQLKALAAVAKKYGLLVVADEIYGEVSHSAPHHSLASYYPEGTIVTGGLSKWCGAGGWRLGLALIPEALDGLRKKMIATASDTYSCVSAPVQYAAVKAFEGSPEIEEYLAHSNAVLKTIGHYVANKLNSNNIFTPFPDGGFYLFPDFENYRDAFNQRGMFNSQQLCEKLLEKTGVALLPGTAFGGSAHKLTARMAYVDFDGSAALKWCEDKGGISDETAFLHSCCPNIVEGINRLANYVQKLIINNSTCR